MILNDTYHVGCIPISAAISEHDLLFGSVFEIGDTFEKSYCFFWLQGSKILLLPSGCLMYFTPWFKLEIIESEPPAS